MSEENRALIASQLIDFIGLLRTVKDTNQSNVSDMVNKLKQSDATELQEFGLRLEAAIQLMPWRGESSYSGENTIYYLELDKVDQQQELLLEDLRNDAIDYRKTLNTQSGKVSRQKTFGRALSPGNSSANVKRTLRSP